MPDLLLGRCWVCGVLSPAGLCDECREGLADGERRQLEAARDLERGDELLEDDE